MDKLVVTVKSISTRAFSVALVSIPQAEFGVGYRLLWSNITEGGDLKAERGAWVYYDYSLASKDFDIKLRELEGQ